MINSSYPSSTEPAKTVTDVITAVIHKPVQRCFSKISSVITGQTIVIMAVALRKYNLHVRHNILQCSIDQILIGVSHDDESLAFIAQ